MNCRLAAVVATLWPSGLVQRLENVAGNQIVKIRESIGLWKSEFAASAHDIRGVRTKLLTLHF